MAATEAAQLIAGEGAAQRRRVLIACIVATCARNLEAPPWVYFPPDPSAFNQASNTFSSLTSMFSLTMLAFVLLGGVIGDLYGRRRILLVGLGGVVVANLLLLFSPATPWFVFTRVLAWGFGAMVLPLSLSNLYVAYAGLPEARARALAVYVLVTSTAFLLSGVIGLLTFAAFSWRVPILLPTALGIVAFVLVRQTIAESRVRVRHRFDVIGHSAWALVVLSGIGGAVAWRGIGTFARFGMLLSLAGLLAGIGLLFWWDRRTPDSIFARSQIKRRVLIVLILFGLAMQFGFVGYVLQVRNVLIQVYDYGSVLATIALAPLLVGMLLMTVYATRRLVAVEPKLLMASGILVGGAVCAITALTRVSGYYPSLALLLTAFGASMVLATITWTATFLTAVPEDVVGVRTGISSSVFQMGGIFGNIIPGALLVQLGVAAYDRLLESAGVPPERSAEALAALNSLLDPTVLELGMPPDIASRLIAGYEIAYLDAFGGVMLLLALVCAAGAALVWFGFARLRAAGSTHGAVQER